MRNRGFKFRPRKKEVAPITREDLLNTQKASKEELLRVQQHLGYRIDGISALLRQTPRERLRQLKARLRLARSRRRRG